MKSLRHHLKQKKLISNQLKLARRKKKKLKKKFLLKMLNPTLLKKSKHNSNNNPPALAGGPTISKFGNFCDVIETIKKPRTLRCIPIYSFDIVLNLNNHQSIMNVFFLWTKQFHFQQLGPDYRYLEI